MNGQMDTDADFIGNLWEQHMMTWGGVSVVEAAVTSLRAAEDDVNKHLSSSAEQHLGKLFGSEVL